MPQVMRTTNKVSKRQEKYIQKQRKREIGQQQKKRKDARGKNNKGGRDRIRGTRSTEEFKDKGEGGGQGEERTD